MIGLAFLYAKSGPMPPFSPVFRRIIRLGCSMGRVRLLLVWISHAGYRLQTPAPGRSCNPCNCQCIHRHPRITFSGYKYLANVQIILYNGTKGVTTNIMTTVKNLLESVYYVAFIILTFLLVRYSIKTYLFQTKASSSLFCKLFILRDTLGKSEQTICLEIYNHGNIPATKVSAALGGKEIGVVDFIKPEDSAVLVVGEALRMMNGNRLFIQGEEIIDKMPVPLSVSLNGRKADEIQLQTSTLFLHNDTMYNEEERIAQGVEKINRTLEKAFDCHKIGPGHGSFRDELCSIAKGINTRK